MANRKSSAVVMPNKGLFLDRPSVAIPPEGLSDCRNVRLKEGKVSNTNMGWDKFFSQQLSGRVLLIDNFYTRGGAQQLIFGTPKDLYQYDQTGNKPLFLSRRYETGTVSSIVYNPGPDDSTVTGSGTAWDTNLKAGDYMFFGATGERDPASTWYEIKSVDSPTQVTVKGDASAESTGAYTARIIFTGDDWDYWSAETFPDAQPEDKDLWFATNGIDEIVEWDGSATQVSLTGISFKAKILRRHKNMMCYAQIVDSGESKPQTVINSDVANPKDFTGLSSEQVVVGGVDWILAVEDIGDYQLVYAERSLTVRQFVGSPLIFINRTAITGIGPIAGRAIADFGDFHEFIGPDGGYDYNGVGIREIGANVFREVLRQMAPDRRDEALAHIDEENGEVLWLVPLTTDPSGPTTAYTEHYLEPKTERDPTPFAVRDFPATATGYFQRQSTLRFSDILDTWEEQDYRWNDRFFQALFPYNLFGDENGYIYTLATSQTQDGAAIDSWARFGRRPLVDGRQKGVLKRVYPFAPRRAGADDYGLGVIVWTTDHADGDLNKNGPIDYDLTQATTKNFVSFRVAGRFAEIEFATNGVNRAWEIGGYDVDAVPIGSR